MSFHFSLKTFKYFESAIVNDSEKWFKDNKNLYLENVKEPFTYLLNKIDLELGEFLPDIKIKPQSVSRPLWPAYKHKTHGVVKKTAHVKISETRNSLFEWNPGIYISVGPDKEDCVLFVGLYMVSGRQIKLLRRAWSEDFETIDGMLNRKKFKKVWGEPGGQRYKRFPRDYDPDDPRNKYLWFKQFYVRKEYTRTQVKKKDFSDQIILDLKEALPLLSWIRGVVGVSPRRKRKKADW